MSVRTLLRVQSVLFILAGLVTLFAPQQFMATYGAELNEPGIGLARLFGATSLMAAVIYWLGGTTTPSEARRALVIGGLVGNILAAVVGILNVLSGAFNALLWGSVVLWLLLALGFAYFLFARPEAA
jgi:hypothetical protein